MQKLALILFFLALFVTGLVGTETRLLFFWPEAGVLGLAGLLAVLRWRLKISFQPSDTCLLSVLALAVYVGWRAWASPVEVYAREDAVIMLSGFVAYLLTVTAASHPKWRLGIFCVLLVLAAGNLTAGWLHFKGRWDFHLVPGFSRSFPPGRIGGFYNNPNHLAAFLSFVSFLAAGVMLFARIHLSSRLLLGFGILAMWAGVALTLSRAAMLGMAAGGLLFVGVVLWLVWRTRREYFKWAVVALLLFAGGVGVSVYKANEDALVTRQLSTPLGEDMRSHIWRAARAQHAEAPLTGVGARMFYEGGTTHRDPATPSYSGDPLFAHNEYLQMLADYGWVGLVLLGWVVLAHFFNGLRFLRWFAAEKFPAIGMLGSNALALAVGGLAALTATLVHAGFEFQAHVPAIAVLGAVVLGLLASPGIESDTPAYKPRRIPGLRLGLKLVLLAASSALIAGAVLYGPPDMHGAAAQVQMKHGQVEAALQSLKQATEADPRNAALAYQHGVALLDSYKPQMTEVQRRALIDQAAVELKRATTLNAFNHLYQLAYADALDASGKTDAALVAIQRALKLAPLHEEPRIALGMHYHRLGQFEDAERAYLWAGEAKAMNPEGTTNWQDNYRQLLRHTAILAERERAARSKTPQP